MAGKWYFEVDFSSAVFHKRAILLIFEELFFVTCALPF